MDKVVYEQNGIGQNDMDKMVRTEWYGQNGIIFGIDFNSSEFNTYLVTKSQTSDKHTEEI